MHDYPALGHAAPGRNLQELWTGFFIGHKLDQGLSLGFSYMFSVGAHAHHH